MEVDEMALDVGSLKQKLNKERAPHRLSGASSYTSRAGTIVFAVLRRTAKRSGGFVEGEDNTELIIHYLTMLGEASNNITDEYAAAHPEIDFKGMASLRYKLVHDYANINLDIIWKVIGKDIPVQAPRVKALSDAMPKPKTPDNLSEFE